MSPADDVSSSMCAVRTAMGTSQTSISGGHQNSFPEISTSVDRWLSPDQLSREDAGDKGRWAL